MGAIAFVIDPLATLVAYKDTTLAFIEAAFSLKQTVFIIQSRDMWQTKDGVFADAYRVESINKSVQELLTPQVVLKDVLTLSFPYKISASDLSIVFMRKDPPFDHTFLVLTQWLSVWEKAGVRIINPPTMLRLLNEKRFIFEFTDYIADTIITSNVTLLSEFIATHKTIIFKPLDAMGGAGIIKLSYDQPDLLSVLNSCTQAQTIPWMAQCCLDVFKEGDKRIILLNGVALPFALARFPKEGGYLANLAAGGSGTVVPLTPRDYVLAKTVGDYCRQHDLALVGMDVIDGMITEVNITSPTCLREIQTHTGTYYVLPFMQSIIDDIA